MNLPFHIDIASYASSIIFYVGYGLLFMIIFGLVAFFVYYLMFNIKATVYNLYGAPSSSAFSVGAPRKNKVKWIKNKTAWRPLWPLFNNKEIEPFKNEFIYPGNRIMVFQYNDVWIPGKIELKLEEDDSLVGRITPVPYFIRNWQSLQHKKYAMMFAKHNFWEDNKQFILGMITVIACCVCAGLTVYLTYQFAAGGTNQISQLTDAINNLG